MKLRSFLRLLILGSIAFPTLASADDPNDPTMTPEAIARDQAMIRKLNRDQLEYVRRRDARQAQEWRDYARYKNGTHPDQIAYRRARARYERDLARNASERRRYDQAMAEWRADVSACRAGRYERCR